MKFSEQWLREWVKTDISSSDLQHKLTLSGLEVDSVTPVAGVFTDIVVGFVQSKEKHPDADKLSVCMVDLGEGEPVQIVCGAQNVAANMKVPVAKIGAVLGGDFKIKKSKLRGVISNGMICSESELGLAETSDGIMPLPEDAPIGQDIRAYLQLDDNCIDIDLTPNRGDCLSIAGIARETAALTGAALTPVAIKPVAAKTNATFSIAVQTPHACPRYVGRVIENISLNVASPLWLKEKLRRSGLRSIDPVVDVTNYVMLELGQPMHAFDLNQLNGQICVRMAKANEKITLLDGAEKTLTDDTLVIADSKQPLAIAGVMGGQASGVSAGTKNIFLESAYFTPEVMAGKARQYQAHTDSSHRFERGVDFDLQKQAIERATVLLLEIVGGAPGPVIEVVAETALPKRETIHLRHRRLMKLLGCDFAFDDVTALLTNAGFAPKTTAEGWAMTPPSYRFDLAIEADFIEEVARLSGYANIPATLPSVPLLLEATGCKQRLSVKAKSLLSAFGYHEVITYSFVNAKQQSILHPDCQAFALSNPISNDMAVMRTSLWTGLLQTVKYNLARQATRLRLFEAGMCFIQEKNGLQQKNMLAGVITGSRLPEQWAVAAEKSDFYDIKSDVVRLCNGLGFDVAFIKGEISGLHPGQTAMVVLNDKTVGYVGSLHPEAQQTLKLPPVLLFSLCLDDLSRVAVKHFQSISKFPSVSRDLAIVLDDAIQAAEVLSVIRASAGDLLSDLQIFDVYKGENVPDGQQSLAIRLTLTPFDDTLADAKVNEIIDAVVASLAKTFKAHLR